MLQLERVRRTEFSGTRKAQQSATIDDDMAAHQFSGNPIQRGAVIHKLKYSLHRGLKIYSVLYYSSSTVDTICPHVEKQRVEGAELVCGKRRRAKNMHCTR
jgi:hypothetical protein